MGLFRTIVAGKVEQVKREQHWQAQTAAIVRPMQIKLRAAEQVLAVSSVLEADAKLKKVFDSIKLTNPE